jgi:hypothetical protein
MKGKQGKGRQARRGQASKASKEIQASKGDASKVRAAGRHG